MADCSHHDTGTTTDQSSACWNTPSNSSNQLQPWPVQHSCHSTGHWGKRTETVTFGEGELDSEPTASTAIPFRSRRRQCPTSSDPCSTSYINAEVGPTVHMVTLVVSENKVTRLRVQGQGKNKDIKCSLKYGRSQLCAVQDAKWREIPKQSPVAYLRTDRAV